MGSVSSSTIVSIANDRLHPFFVSKRRSHLFVRLLLRKRLHAFRRVQEHVRLLFCRWNASNSSASVVLLRDASISRWSSAASSENTSGMDGSNANVDLDRYLFHDIEAMGNEDIRMDGDTFQGTTWKKDNLHRDHNDGAFSSKEPQAWMCERSSTWKCREEEKRNLSSMLPSFKNMPMQSSATVWKRQPGQDSTRMAKFKVSPKSNEKARSLAKGDLIRQWQDQRIYTCTNPSFHSKLCWLAYVLSQGLILVEMVCLQKVLSCQEASADNWADGKDPPVPLAETST